MSTARGEGARPGREATAPASEDDRERVVERLRTAAGDGVIDLDELEIRLGSAYAARTLPELAPLTADLPDASGSRAPDRERSGPSALAVPAFRVHVTVYALTIALLFVIWAAAGGGLPVWPLFPAAGWGIGVGAHWQLAQLTARRRAARRTRRDPSSAAPDHRGPGRPRVAAPGIPAIATASLSEPSRRFVVAMFVDVVGSTSLNEALGDEQWAVVRRSFRSVVADCVTDQGGWEANSNGDGVLARFHDPAAAAGAAVEVLRRLEAQRDERGFAPSVRIGIHSGDAVEEGADIIGNVVNLAARVTEAAEADEVLVTEHVADHLDGRHRTEGRGLQTLKGVARPRHLLALAWR